MACCGFNQEISRGSTGDAADFQGSIRSSIFSDVFLYFSPNKPLKSPILSWFLLYAYRWQLCVQYIMCIWRFPEIGVPPFMEPPIYNYIYIHTYIHPSKGSFTALSTVTLALQSLPTNRDNLEYRINLIPYLEIYLKYPQGGNRSPND